MQLTESWKNVMPQSILDRYDIAETRNAAGVLLATSPEAFADIVEVLDGFELNLDKLTTPGGNKTVIAKELDETFRVHGWREARFDQTVTTRLTIFRWTASPDPDEEQRVIETTNEYGGHKVDNVLGRAALDVEWNPKDGNLDRDLANFVGLYESGVIDSGVIVTRLGEDFRHFVRELIAAVKAVRVPKECTAWRDRMKRLADDPLGTSTTSNFTKLVPRMERGDGRGCPLLTIAITERCYVPPPDSIKDEVLRLAEALG
ncbi:MULTISPECIES: BglII/BstYI family type II restriction endonuclease [Mycobacteriaceae]|nr:BglII/BstYI family type II restriction endonuclease [Mycobacterium avium]ETA90984.1 restriction endonuclease BglII [Mycobacterium avium 05-4293]ETB21325.1 restriction endonuclease BglII [Mycobacterium avium 09-5983]ETB41804.1 restriction endonuclease BglII [Mycobacterium avium 11-0986]MDV3247493.1 restriction endonuclease [Mycobacterium avium subsp. hominissuis]MDV3273922.1 restriction endonuclease [Mycobacterium avium subsp. hominissuis]